MIDMAKRDRSKPKSPKPQRSGKNINVWIDADLHDAFSAFMEEARPKPTLKAAIEAAIEVYLTGLGRWPTTEDDGD